MSSHLEQATFGAGCFWCIEAVFQRLNGVEQVVSGYAGGHTEDPTYYDVIGGGTGHAECAQITFDPSIISYEKLLEVFWKTHDPTTLNRQGADVGTQYRSVILFHNDAQQKAAENIKQQLDASGAWGNPIVTEIAPLNAFYQAELHHQNYYNQNGNNSYCQFVIVPKLAKFDKIFSDLLK